MPLADEATLEGELDRLFGLPLDEFTAARDELSRRARSEGQRAVAARVKELRKPTLAAWVVNQLTRRRQLDVQRLIKAGEALASAQVEAIVAGSSPQFRDARREEQRAIDRLGPLAREVLESSGRPATSVERVLSTLRAAALTDEGRELLKRGRLTEELEQPGFEALAHLPAPSNGRTTKSQRGRSPRGSAPSESERRSREARERINELGKELRALERESRAAERRLEHARRELESAELDAEAIDRRRRAAAEGLAAAKEEAAKPKRRS